VNAIAVFVQTVVAENAATGEGPTLITCVVVCEHPNVDVVTSVTVYVPDAENVCEGFNNVEVLLPPEAGSPKFQA
jgi:ABC-type Zn uptake system ZnuABC Zn-binding protein ZnuA